MRRGKNGHFPAVGTTSSYTNVEGCNLQIGENSRYHASTAKPAVKGTTENSGLLLALTTQSLNEKHFCSMNYSYD